MCYQFGLDPSSSSFTTYDLHCLLHFYRVIGHCLGIEDRFNLCETSSNGKEGDEEVVERCRQLYYQKWKPRIESAPEVIGSAMAEGIGVAAFQSAPFACYRSVMHYVAPTLGLADHADFQLKTLSDYLFYAMFSLVMGSVLRYKFAMWLISKLLRAFETLSFWCRQVHVFILDWWYSNDPKYQFPADANGRFLNVLKNFQYKAAWEHRLL